MEYHDQGNEVHQHAQIRDVGNRISVMVPTVERGYVM